MPSNLSRKEDKMSDKAIKVNWNLFEIVRKHPVAKDVSQIPDAIPTPKEHVPLSSEKQQTMLYQKEQQKNVLPPKARRIPASDEPLAFCAKCGDWTPMLWLPKEERGHAVETWFECEYCGCRELKLRYIVRS